MNDALTLPGEIISVRRAPQVSLESGAAGGQVARPMNRLYSWLVALGLALCLVPAPAAYVNGQPYVPHGLGARKRLEVRLAQMGR